MPYIYEPSNSVFGSIVDLTAKCLSCNKSGHWTDMCPNLQTPRKNLAHRAPQRTRVATPFPTPSQVRGPPSEGLPSNRRSSILVYASRDTDFPSLPAISPNNCLLNSPMSTSRKDVPEIKWGEVSITPAAILPGPLALPQRSPQSLQPPYLPTPQLSSALEYDAAASSQSKRENPHFEDALWGREIIMPLE